METGRVLRLAVLLALTGLALRAQIIEFESGGLRYQALTRNGLTIMVAQLESQVRDYSVLQVAVSNGSRTAYTTKPEDFLFTREDGLPVPVVPARTVVSQLVDKGSRGDVIRLVTAYEAGLYGNSQYKATNGYEERRRNAFAEVSSTKLKAAAAASAIAFVQTKLLPGESSDGAVFYASAGKPLGTGKLRVVAAGSVFEFPMLSSN